MANLIVLGIVIIVVRTGVVKVPGSGSWCPASLEFLGVANDHSMMGIANGFVLDRRQDSAGEKC